MMGCIFAANCAFFSFNHHKLITRTNPALKLALHLTPSCSCVVCMVG